MPRVKSGPGQRRRHKKVIKAASGYWGSRHRTFKMAKQTLIRAYRYSWQHRRQKKRVMRRLWIARINAALRVKNISYSKFINLIKSKQISLNRKVLADMATSHPQAFYSLLDKLISS